MTYLKRHRKRVGISAAIAAIGWNIVLLTDSAFWQTWAMAGISFLLLSAFMYVAISAFGLLGMTQARSDSKIKDAAALALSEGFIFDPADADWIRADRLYREAIELEPTNIRAASAREFFLYQTLEEGAARFGVEKFGDLPSEYKEVLNNDTQGFLWFNYVDRPPRAVRPNSRLRRGRRFLVSGVGGIEGTKPNWIVGLIAGFLVITAVSVEARADVESVLANRYRSVCESVLGDCGGKIRGFDKSDAFNALKAELRQRPLIHSLTGESYSDSPCWDWVNNEEVQSSVKESEGYFEFSFGYTYATNIDRRERTADLEFIATSRWKAVPPLGSPEWTISPILRPRLPTSYSCDEATADAFGVI